MKVLQTENNEVHFSEMLYYKLYYSHWNVGNTIDVTTTIQMSAGHYGSIQSHADTPQRVRKATLSWVKNCTFQLKFNCLIRSKGNQIFCDILSLKISLNPRDIVTCQFITICFLFHLPLRTHSYMLSKAAYGREGYVWTHCHTLHPVPVTDFIMQTKCECWTCS